MQATSRVAQGVQTTWYRRLANIIATCQIWVPTLGAFGSQGNYDQREKSNIGKSCWLHRHKVRLLQMSIVSNGLGSAGGSENNGDLDGGTSHKVKLFSMYVSQGWVGQMGQRLVKFSQCATAMVMAAVSRSGPPCVPVVEGILSERNKPM
ncbi:hypothetical protein MCOR02_012259 [Pyricularia oryzae]|uniref:Uncharacterized protein n=1 Tax=Pyricularia oryzae TaxID=318829 RepID=A0A4P7NIM0_PYROR|nr:hypothetical protein MCOR01_003829 [Pyricularia oryzae]KAH9427353.1 hypothetical protein MCOR02_012259 [Pyricularia oryzae]KAI6255853.1 hypothetical protein MCOR19_007656 [Pyricularia oryzae]KAI6264070.1 hypothetical protein MCOR26_011612 [Pyricularia oryzae]KAI6293314.1 hypothetical protein MCOR29_011600 [Pyricularia oryzae]